MLSRSDWDSFETSWDFETHPMIRWSKDLWDVTAIGAAMQCYYGGHPQADSPLELCYLLWKGQVNQRFRELKANEEELNRIFIDIYGLQGELTPDVAEKDVTVYRIIDQPDAEQRKMAYVLSMRDEIVSLLSYMVGCMLGRYSPYVDGLLYAGGEWSYDAVCARIAQGAGACDFYDPALGLFLPDHDGIVPVTDDDYLPDDIVTRTAEFVRKVYGADTLEENLRFIADALGGKGDSPRQVIRNYYLHDFYTDHLKTYQKRPIYWQFDAGKQDSFKCLMYLHRYDRDTVARVRTDPAERRAEGPGNRRGACACERLQARAEAGKAAGRAE